MNVVTVRRRFTLVEAMQFTEENWPALLDWMGWEWPAYERDHMPDGLQLIDVPDVDSSANPGDWIVRVDKGLLVAYSDSEFHEMFETAPAAALSERVHENDGFCTCSAKFVAHRHLGPTTGGRETTEAERARYRQGGLL